ncbi:MAG: ABC transporter permease, partial [Candidatus Eiseniibacteriota bacterium]
MTELLVSVLRAGTPLIYVAMAGVLAQLAGIWHLGLEGLMITGACAALLGTVQTGSLLAGLLIAAAFCVAGSLLLWVAVELLRASPIIAGLGLTGLG